MSVKYVFTKNGFILHECNYNRECDDIYRKFAKAKKPFSGFGKTKHLQRKMSKTRPQGKVFHRLLSLKTDSLFKEV